MARPFVALVLLLVAGCQWPGSAHGCSNVQIDWVDFIQVGSTQYVVGPGTPKFVQEGNLGRVVAHVKFKVSGNVCDPSYRPKDGDAAFLEPGTPIYEVTGHPAGDMLAARHDGQIWAYEAHSP
jgi:hypothetical protein